MATVVNLAMRFAWYLDAEALLLKPSLLGRVVKMALQRQYLTRPLFHIIISYGVFLHYAPVERLHLNTDVFWIRRGFAGRTSSRPSGRVPCTRALLDMFTCATQALKHTKQNEPLLSEIHAF